LALVKGTVHEKMGVSTTSVVNGQRISKHFTGVNDTGDKLITGVLNTGDLFFPRINDTCDQHWLQYHLTPETNVE
jgi:hypothetical protein